MLYTGRYIYTDMILYTGRYIYTDMILYTGRYDFTHITISYIYTDIIYTDSYRCIETDRQI